MNARKRALFGGLTALGGSLLAICLFMSNLAFDREGDVNRVLGIKGSTSDTSDEYKTKEEMLAAEKEYMIQTVEEGSVLLRNEKDALPLAGGEHVTLFGNASVNSVFHGASGGPSNSGTTLLDALNEEGFSVNPTVYQKIQNQKVTRGDSNIGEVDASIYDKNDFTGYTDAAIVVLSRYGGEANDMDVKDSFGVPELSFHEAEKEMMEKVKEGGFKKVIVLLNTGYAMDLGWLDDYAVDACLWIGFPGQYGMEAVAKMLDGKAYPSGHLVDTYATSSLSSPAMQNFGDFTFSDLENVLYHNKYVVYAEDIYVGYKYYESRYYDQVKGLHNATSSSGVFAGESSWDYASEVVYPFGYGLGYTTFTETLDSLSWDQEKHEVNAMVTVKNTGSKPGKDAVELYVSLPYEEGGLEKSAIQLAGYTKTKEMKAGEEEKVSLSFSDYIFATYDSAHTNGKDTTKKGCYVFDKGDYQFALGFDAHDALNNVLALEGNTNLVDPDGNSVTGDKNKVKTVYLASNDNKTYATNPTTGALVSNQFEDIDYNHFVQDKITYLTRKDWNTFPKSYTDLSASDDTSGTIKKYMSATSSLYTKPSDAPDVTSFKFNKSEPDASTTTKFLAMKDVAYDDDEKWNAFIDQLTPSTLASLFGEKMGNDAIPYISFPKSASGDGPDGLQSGGSLHPSENLAASTWNLDLLEERGKFLALDASMNVGYAMVYGGGCNLHRTPYGGRNFEYYSEDATVSYYCGAIQGKAMSDGGLLAAYKHFLGNDQETNRHGVATFMTEQTLRQNDARAFEGALTKGHALANMSSYNRLGVISTACDKALMNNLLREEWGFEGVSITDSSKDAKSYLFTAEALDAGTDMFNNDGDRATEVKDLMVKQRDGHIWECARKTAKRYFYSFVRSNVINSLDENTVVTSSTPWWKIAIIALDSTIGVATLVMLTFYILFMVKGRKEN